MSVVVGESVETAEAELAGTVAAMATVMGQGNEEMEAETEEEMEVVKVWVETCGKQQKP